MSWSEMPEQRFAVYEGCHCGAILDRKSVRVAKYPGVHIARDTALWSGESGTADLGSHVRRRLFPE